jgi:RHS repeat-associated protein
VDSYNHTGYAQVLEETIVDNLTPSTNTITYTIGDDIITQATYNGTTSVSKHLLYDGHGSTRQLVDASEGITDYYSYDAYGVMLGGNPTPASPAATNMLYAGEQWDTDMQQYYLRARYYDQNTGRFNRIDPFAGNNQDPQSLHKYLYCHANPINGIDPSGRGMEVGLMVFLALCVIVVGIVLVLLSPRRFRMEGSAARGTSVYVDFSNFHLSGITFTDGSAPNEESVKRRVLELMNQEYNKAEVDVSDEEKRKPDDKITQNTPLLSFTQDRIVRERDDGSRYIRMGYVAPGGTRPKVPLGNFSVEELNGRLEDNKQLARAIAFLACHEVGHTYLLSDVPGPSGSGNIMRGHVVPGNPEPTGDQIISGLLVPSSYNDDQIRVIYNVALTGSKGQ